MEAAVAAAEAILNINVCCDEVVRRGDVTLPPCMRALTDSLVFLLVAVTASHPC